MAQIPPREQPAVATNRQPEETLLVLKPGMWRNRPFAFLLCVLLLCVPAIALAIAARFDFKETHTILVASLIPAAVGVFVFMVWRLRCSSTELTITTRRCILRRGIMSRFTTEVRHCDIRNIQVHQTLLQRIFGVGYICISSESEDEHDISVYGIPHPNRIAESIRKVQ